MTAATVTAAIERLDALSRIRALTDGESRQLQKLLTVERRYGHRARTQAAASAAAAPHGLHLVARDGIVVRLDATLAALRATIVIRAIYLTADDFAALEIAGALEHGDAGEPRFRGHPVRLSKAKTANARSVIYDSYGCARAVVQRARR